MYTARKQRLKLFSVTEMTRPSDHRIFFPKASRKATHRVKKRIEFVIKNCDRNGPEGQFKTIGSTVCNAGLPSYSQVFMISREPIKVSMKKKKEEKGVENPGGGRLKIYLFLRGPCTTANIQSRSEICCGARALFPVACVSQAKEGKEVVMGNMPAGLGICWGPWTRLRL